MDDRPTASDAAREYLINYTRGVIDELETTLSRYRMGRTDEVQVRADLRQSGEILTSLADASLEELRHGGRPQEGREEESEHGTEDSSIEQE